MKTFTERSKPLIKKVLSENRIYSISSFDPKCFCVESNRTHENNFNSNRSKFLNSNYGFVSCINDYDTFFGRIFDFALFQDYSVNLRHKINIIHTLIEGDMDTLVPVHISIKPRHTKVQGKIELKNLYENFSNFSMITHPGFTRSIGSVFLNQKLKNVFLYINKKFNISLKEDTNIKELKTSEQLLPYFNGVDYKKDQNYTLDFHLVEKPGGDTVNNLKYHKYNETYILKLHHFMVKDTLDAHPSVSYLPDTFNTFNSYCKLLFSNRVKIYTNDEFKLKNKLNENFNNLPYDNNSQYVNNFEKPITNIPIHPLKLKKYSNLTDEEISIYQKIYEGTELNTDKKEKYLLNNNLPLLGSEIELLDSLDPNTIVEKNNFTGIAVTIDEKSIEYMNRSFAELIMCALPNSSSVESEDGLIKIINCSHKFWKTNKEENKKILNTSFFNI